MNYWMLASAATTAYMLLKPPKSPPLTQVKSATVQGRKYIVTRAGLGIFKVELASDPTVFQLFNQQGPLQSGGDSVRLSILKSDMQQFPQDLFK